MAIFGSKKSIRGESYAFFNIVKINAYYLVAANFSFTTSQLITLKNALI